MSDRAEFSLACRWLLPDADGELVRDAVVVVRGGRIAYAGAAATAPRDLPPRVALSEDAVIVPGFWNLHAHSESGFRRALRQGVFEHSNFHVHEVRALADADAIYWRTLKVAARALVQGTVGAVDFVYGNPALADFGLAAVRQAYEDLGMRAGIGIALRDRQRYLHAPDRVVLDALDPSDAEVLAASDVGYVNDSARVIEVTEALVREHSARVRMMLQPDWTPACSDELYLSVARLADRLGVTVQTHLAETKFEVLAALRADGVSPVVRLDRLGILGALGSRLSLAHSVWLDDSDTEIVAESGSIIVHNPASNLRLASGIAPVSHYLDRGIAVAMGTDCISLADDDDPIAELRLAGLLMRSGGSTDYAFQRVPARRLLRMATAHGAQAIGAPASGGVVEGAVADFVAVDLSGARDRGRFESVDPLELLVDRAHGRDVELVVVEGRVVARDGRTTLIDLDRIEDRAAEHCERMTARSVPPDTGLAGALRAAKRFAHDYYEDLDAGSRVESAVVYNGRLQVSPSQRGIHR